MTDTILDFRSDTVTKPTADMLQAMMSARVGDDVYQEDPTVIELEQEVAALFGQEAGLFCVSGTMSNQLAVMAQTRPGQEVICSDLCHIYHYEAGGLAANSGVQVNLIHHAEKPGHFTLEQVQERLRDDTDVHLTPTAMVAVEDTSNRGGGTVWDTSTLEELSAYARKHNVSFHLDGARVWNRLAKLGEDSVEYGKRFDSISVCLSKGLGAPMGSVLLGNREMIRQARWFRKRLGGGVRQAGYIAAAGLYAVRHHRGDALRADHTHARTLAKLLEQSSLCIEVQEPETNIVLAKMHDAAKFKATCKQEGVLLSTIDKHWVRFVTHQDVRMERAYIDVERMLSKLEPS